MIGIKTFSNELRRNRNSEITVQKYDCVVSTVFSVTVLFFDWLGHYKVDHYSNLLIRNTRYFVKVSMTFTLSDWDSSTK